jgi:peptidoglycan/LPS O-acetylase OafA/YrhL
MTRDIYRLNQPTVIFLDILRGSASQLVVIGHILQMQNVRNYIGLPESYTKIPSMAGMAVSIFFLLSGFLITHTIWRKKNGPEGYSFKAYLIERFSRIYSGFTICILFILIIDTANIFWLGPGGFEFHYALTLKDFLGNLLMLQDAYQHSEVMRAFPIGFKTFGSARPLWSVSLEWWIYLFAGWMWLVKPGAVGKKYWIVLLMLAAIPLGNLGIANKISLRTQLTQTWFMGAIVFFIFFSGIYPVRKSFAKFSTIAMFIIAFVRYLFYAKADPYDPTFQFSFFLFFLFAIYWLMQKKDSLPKGLQVFSSTLASYSYTLYLVHFSLIYFLNRAVENKWYVVFGGFLGCNVIAFLLAQIGESRNLDWRKFFIQKIQT